MKKLLSIALVLILSITFVSAAQGVSLDSGNEIPHFETLENQSNLDISIVDFVEFEAATNFVLSNSYLFVCNDTLINSSVTIEYDKLNSIATKHLSYKGSNPIIAIYFPDSYCLSLGSRPIYDCIHLFKDQRTLFSLSRLRSNNALDNDCSFEYYQGLTDKSKVLFLTSC